MMAAMRRWGWVAASVIVAAFGARAAEPVPLLIVDGESGGPYHDWPRVTTVLEKILGEVGLFDVSIATAPPAGGDFAAFAPDFSVYDVVVLNYDAPDERWPTSLKRSLERYVEDGGGLVAVHAADNATLERQWSLLEPFSRTYISVSQPGLDLLALSERHIPILDALRARDPDAAAAAMHDHLMEAAALLRPMTEGDPG